jgi:hypothetical protein
MTTTRSVSGSYLAQIKSECLLGDCPVILKNNLTKRVLILENKNAFSMGVLMMMEGTFL